MAMKWVAQTPAPKLTPVKARAPHRHAARCWGVLACNQTAVLLDSRHTNAAIRTNLRSWS